jgi:hypothetical protein
MKYGWTSIAYKMRHRTKIDPKLYFYQKAALLETPKQNH